MKTSFRRVRNFALGTALGTACLAFAGSAPALAEDIIVGLITKTEINPFFVKMKEGAQAKAKELGVELRSYAGKVDGDNEGQVAAIESLIAAGAKGILITPSDTKAIVPAVEKAREAGIMVIALDTPLEPITAADANHPEPAGSGPHCLPASSGDVHAERPATDVRAAALETAA